MTQPAHLLHSHCSRTDTQAHSLRITRNSPSSHFNRSWSQNSNLQSSILLNHFVLMCCHPNAFKIDLNASNFSSASKGFRNLNHWWNFYCFAGLNPCWIDRYFLMFKFHLPIRIIHHMPYIHINFIYLSDFNNFKLVAF